jgi:hypothetical protein
VNVVSIATWKHVTNVTLREMVGRPEEQVYAAIERLAAEHGVRLDQHLANSLHELAAQCASGTLVNLT